jgi:large subunit ribosomal protein L25
MTISFEIPAETRDVMGKGASRRLRRVDNKVPAILYGAHKPAVNLSINHDFLIKALEHEAFYSHILTVEVGGHKEQVVLKALQRHPYKPRVLHVDLLRIDANEKLTMRIPLHFTGGDIAPGVADDGGVISHLISDLEVRCLPANLPEYLALDLSEMALNQSLHLSDIKLPTGVEIVQLGHGEDATVVSLHMPRVMVEEEPVAEGEAAPADAVPTTVEQNKDDAQ